MIVGRCLPGISHDEYSRNYCVRSPTDDCRKVFYGDIPGSGQIIIPCNCWSSIDLKSRVMVGERECRGGLEVGVGAGDGAPEVP